MSVSFRTLFTALVGFVLFGVSNAHAQTPVFVIGQAPDIVGSRLVYAVKEGIRRSSGLHFVERPQDGFIGLYIVSLDPDSDTAQRGLRTIYSVVWTLKSLGENQFNVYLTSIVGTCGANRVPEFADSIVAITDDEASKFLSLLQDLAKPSKR